MGCKEKLEGKKEISNIFKIEKKNLDSILLYFTITCNSIKLYAFSEFPAVYTEITRPCPCGVIFKH